MPCNVGDCLQSQPPRIIAAHHHRKRVLKPQSWPNQHLVPLVIQLRHLPMYAGFIACSRLRQRLLQDRRQRRSGVLHIRVNTVRDQRLLAQITPCQPEPPLHLASAAGLDLLRQQLTQHDLLGEVLRPNHNVRATRRSACGQQQQSNKADRFHRRTTIRFSTKPKIPSAHSAQAVPPEQACQRALNRYRPTPHRGR